MSYLCLYTQKTLFMFLLKITSIIHIQYLKINMKNMKKTKIKASIFF